AASRTSTPGRAGPTTAWTGPERAQRPSAGHLETHTDVTGASRGATVRHVAPASTEPKTSPEVAPKYRPRGSRSSRPNACRRTVRYASPEGRPSARGAHDVPASAVSYTRSRPPGVTRSTSATSGMTNARCGSFGWTTNGNPKSEGRPAATSIHDS